jgi:hypothetical protein
MDYSGFGHRIGIRWDSNSDPGLYLM